MVATYGYEESLPRLPVPKLSTTLQQFLSAIKPLVTQEEYSELLGEASEFVANGIVNAVQNHLVAALKHPEHSCYLNSINDEVNPGIYGELNNDILPRNPYLVLEEDPYAQTINPPNQAQRLASLINLTLKFILAMRSRTLPPDVTPKNKNPLTMYCYRNIFATTRVPAANHISMRKYEKQSHILVICNNQYYALDVLTEDNRIWFNDHDLLLALQEIIDQLQGEDIIQRVNNSIGSLTTQTFKVWKLARQELENSNPELLHTIDLALFVLVLDQNSPQTDQEKTSVISHGTLDTLPGTSIQTGSCTNRWHDKLQLIVTKNSVAGVVWESALMDSTAILRYISDIYTDLILKLAKDIHGLEYTLFDKTEISFVSLSEPIQRPTFTRLQVNHSPELIRLIHLLETRLADLINQHEYKTTVIRLDSHVVQKLKLPLDSVFQMCFQIANYTLYGKMINTLEPITTRKFRDARTELVPIQSELVARLCKTFLSSNNNSVKWELFKRCCEIHLKQYLDAMRGGGFQRHFLAIMHVFRSPEAIEYLNELNKDIPDLKPIPRIHQGEGGDIPAFLANPLIDRVLQPELLILNCGNAALQLFGITPAIDQGFGVGYIIHPDKTIVTILLKHRQTQRFLDTFVLVVNQLKKIMRSEQNILIQSADSEVRKAELQNLQGENEDDRSLNVGKAIPLTLFSETDPIPYREELRSSSDEEVASPVSGKKVKFDAFGGYGYFDFGELDSRDDFLQHTASHYNLEILISLGHLGLSSKLHSRHQSLTNLLKLTEMIGEEMKTKMLLLELIRERLEAQNSSTPDLQRPPEPVKSRSRTEIGRAINMTKFK